MNKSIQIFLSILAGFSIFFIGSQLAGNITSIGFLSALIWRGEFPILLTFIIGFLLASILPIIVFFYYRKKYPYLAFSCLIGMFLALFLVVYMVLNPYQGLEVP